ncbi:MAG: esterase [Pseudomonadota bacterium]|nr:MAG: esterase [Pseudomonadota bacterium]
MRNQTRRAGRSARWATDLWRGLRDYFGSLGRRRDEPVNDLAALRHFLETRASYVAQTSLYGYLRTRAGMIYPQLFDNDEYVRSINIAKWHVWLACLSDLTVYAGGLLMQDPQGSASKVGTLMQVVLAEILNATGTPNDADQEFPLHAKRVQARVAGCDWVRVTDDETPFSESPTALIRWAPIVENLKELDEGIVRNSVRFRWQEIRRDLRRNLDAAAVLQSAA